MKVLFVYSVDDIQSVVTPLRSWSSIQLGISYISAVLQQRGHETTLVVLGSNNSVATNRVIIQSAVMQQHPRLLAFTSTFSQYPFVERTALMVRSMWPDLFLLIGGAHATIDPEQPFAGPFDAVCVGEGEYPASELCDALERHLSPEAIPNLWIKFPDGSSRKNPPREFLRDLDGLPLPDRAMWKAWVKEQPREGPSVLLGRGCPFNCTYCCHHVLRTTAPGEYVRMRSPSAIAGEVDALLRDHPHDHVHLEGESIGLDLQWAAGLCDELHKANAALDHPVEYSCNYRIPGDAAGGDGLWERFRQAGIARVQIGLECGSERVRREILGRSYSNTAFIDTVASARWHGLKVFVFNMIGLPGETLRDHRETVAVNRACQPDGLFTYIFFPYYGTKLYDECVQRGLMKEAPQVPLERRQPVLTLPGFRKTQVRNAYTLFHLRVYRGYKPLWLLVLQCLSIRMKTTPAGNRLFRATVQWPLLRRLRTALASK